MLEKSLFQAILIDLGMTRMQDAVDNPFAETPWTGQLERPGAETQHWPRSRSWLTFSRRRAARC